MLSSNDQDKQKNETPKWKNTLAGVILSFLSANLLLAYNTIMKKMELDFTDAYFLRALLQIFVSFIVIFKKGGNFWILEVDLDKNIHKIRIMFLLAASCASIFNLSDLVAVTYMPIGDAMTIILCGAIPTVILAAIFLGERLRLYKVICTICVVTGIILVIRPPFLFIDEEGLINSVNISEDGNITLDANKRSEDHKYYYFGALGAFVCMLSNAIFRTFMKLLNQNKSSKSSELFLLYHGVLCFVISFTMPLINNNQRILFPSNKVDHYTLWQWFGLFIFAVIGVTNFYMRLKSLRLVGPVVVGFIRTTEILISYMIEITIFHTIPYLSSIFGALLIMLACIGVLFEEKFLKCLPSNVKPIF